jgi:hypothetical protein
MRDRRFIAVHRGGTLDHERRVRMAQWAVQCAARVLPLFQACSNDQRPSRAISIALEWTKGEVTTGVAMKAAVAAHAAARVVQNKSAVAAARAAGHAVACAHASDHCLGAALYAVKAIQAGGMSAEAELQWQLSQLAAEDRELVTSNLFPRLNALAIRLETEPPPAAAPVSGPTQNQDSTRVRMAVALVPVASQNEPH